MNGKGQGGRNILILLVDDEQAVRKVTCEWLERNGCEVLTATDADSAREVFDARQDEISLVLSDMIMPGESGLDLVESLRQSKPGLPAIIASGYGGADLSLAEIESRGIRFVQKPFVLAELLGLIDEMTGA